MSGGRLSSWTRRRESGPGPSLRVSNLSSNSGADRLKKKARLSVLSACTRPPGARRFRSRLGAEAVSDTCA